MGSGSTPSLAWLALVLAALAACEADSPASVADPELVTSCDVRDPECATAVFEAVAVVYGASHPRIERVVTYGAPAGAPDYAGHEWWDPWAADGFPVVDDAPDPRPDELPDDPSLAADPLPDPIGRTRERGDGEVVELVYEFPDEGRLAGDDAGLARRRRLGLVSGALATLRLASEPDHPLDASTPLMDVWLTRQVLHLALAYEALLTLEGLAAGDDDGPFEAASAALDDLAGRLLDPEVTPAQPAWLDGARAAAFRRVAALRTDAHDGRDLTAALRSGPACERQLFRPDAACLHVLPSPDYEDEVAGYRVRTVYHFSTDELWTDVLRPAGENEAVQAAAHELALHFGVVWLRLADGALVREDLFVWDAAEPARAVQEALDRRAVERLGPGTDRSGGGAAYGPTDAWSAVVVRQDSVVRVVQGPAGTDLAPFLAHLEALEVVTEAAP